MYNISKIKEYTPLIHFIETHINTNPLLDIHPIVLNKKHPHPKCPDGYKINVLGIWPGIEQGCYCSYKSNSLTKGKCT